MPYVIPKSIADANRGAFIFDRSNQFDHRGMVLRAVCDLEIVFADLFISFFRQRNTQFNSTRAQKELFTENAMLSSLTRMVKLASYLALIDENEAHDLRVLARLRNMYAHSPKRDQFYRDEEAAKVVRGLRLFAASEEVLSGFDEQGIFLSAYEFLKLRLKERATALHSFES